MLSIEIEKDIAPLISTFGTSLMLALHSHSMAPVSSLQANGTWVFGVRNHRLIRELRGLCVNIQVVRIDKISWNGAGSQGEPIKIPLIYNTDFLVCAHGHTLTTTF